MPMYLTNNDAICWRLREEIIHCNADHYFIILSLQWCRLISSLFFLAYSVLKFRQTGSNLKDSALRMQLSLSFDREKSGNKKTSPKIIPYIIILVIETEDGKGSE